MVLWINYLNVKSKTIDILLKYQTVCLEHFAREVFLNQNLNAGQKGKD